MKVGFCLFLTLACSIALRPNSNIAAQQVAIGTPSHRVSSSFSESINVGFNLRLPGGVTASFGQPGAAASVAGGARFGFGIDSSEGSATFGLSAAQGSRRGAASQAPSVTVMNGQRGFFSDTSQSPFVAGVVPIVGALPGRVPSAAAPPAFSPLQERVIRAGGVAGLRESLRRQPPEGTPVKKPRGATGGTVADKVRDARQSSAGRGALSLAELRRRQSRQQTAAEQVTTQQVQALIDRAEAALADEKFGAARVYLSMAARRASGELKRRLIARLAEFDAR